MNNYTVLDEIKNTVSLKYFLITLMLMCIPFGIFFFLYEGYSFSNEYNLFSFILGEYLHLLFIIPLTLIYTLSFSREIKNHFLVYTRPRIPLSSLIRIKFMANMALTFTIIFLFVFVVFLFSFYLEPTLQFANVSERYLGTSDYVLINESNLARTSLTSFLEYGPLVFGIIYSTWVAFNAVLWSSLAFLFVLLIRNQYIALSLPYILYLGTNYVIFNTFNLHYLRYHYFIFKFNYMELPLLEAMIPMYILIMLFIILIGFVRARMGTIT